MPGSGHELTGLPMPPHAAPRPRAEPAELRLAEPNRGRPPQAHLPPEPARHEHPEFREPHEPHEHRDHRDHREEAR